MGDLFSTALVFTPAQRRRAEALILVRKMWPSLSTERAVQVADWIYRGKARVVQAEASNMEEGRG